MRLIADVLGQLRLERALQHQLGQPAQQTIRPGQPQPLSPRLLDQLPRQLLLVDCVRGRRRWPAVLLLTDRLGHLVSPPPGHPARLSDRSYTVVFTVPINYPVR